MYVNFYFPLYISTPFCQYFSIINLARYYKNFNLLNFEIKISITRALHKNSLESVSSFNGYRAGVRTKRIPFSDT